MDKIMEDIELSMEKIDIVEMRAEIEEALDDIDIEQIEAEIENEKKRIKKQIEELEKDK